MTVFEKAELMVVEMVVRWDQTTVDKLVFQKDERKVVLSVVMMVDMLVEMMV